MNLQFNIALHILLYLAKHSDEIHSSAALAKLVCINSVQLRNVVRILVKNGYVQVKRGTAGGYSATDNIKDIRLSDIYVLFRHVASDERVFTGSSDSHCKIARSMEPVMKDFAEKEYTLVRDFYKTYTVGDVLQSIADR